MTHSYTPAQLRAFAWLPADGSWLKGRRSPAIGRTLKSLYYHSVFVEFVSGRYRLTPAGIAERARLKDVGMIE